MGASVIFSSIFIAVEQKRGRKTSGQLAVQRYYFRTCLQFIQIIRPLLHHFSTFREVRGAIVCASIRIAHSVGKLVFDEIWA
jgi:hypothetical protein